MVAAPDLQGTPAEESPRPLRAGVSWGRRTPANSSPASATQQDRSVSTFTFRSLQASIGAIRHRVMGADTRETGLSGRATLGNGRDCVFWGCERFKNAIDLAMSPRHCTGRDLPRTRVPNHCRRRVGRSTLGDRSARQSYQVEDLGPSCPSATSRCTSIRAASPQVPTGDTVFEPPKCIISASAIPTFKSCIRTAPGAASCFNSSHSGDAASRLPHFNARAFRRIRWSAHSSGNVPSRHPSSYPAAATPTRLVPQRLPTIIAHHCHSSLSPWALPSTCSSMPRPSWRCHTPRNPFAPTCAAAATSALAALFPSRAGAEALCPECGFSP